MSTVSQPRPTGKPNAQPRPPRPAHGVCRLTLAINGVPYSVRPIACDNAAALRCYELRKSAGERYHVSQHPHGAECDCPDFVFQRDGRDPGGCKHIQALAVLGLIGTTVDNGHLPPVATTAPSQPLTDEAWAAHSFGHGARDYCLVGQSAPPIGTTLRPPRRVERRALSPIISPQTAELISRTSMLGHDLD
jgi:hypothetical protein